MRVCKEVLGAWVASVNSFILGAGGSSSDPTLELPMESGQYNAKRF